MAPLQTLRARTRTVRAPMVGAILGVTAALAVIASASAQAVPGNEQPLTGVAGYGAWDWVSLVFRIGLVLVVIWSSVMAMRWYVRRVGGEGGGRARVLQIVETRSLGPNRSLHLVRLGNRAVLIGATAERINALMEVDDPLQFEQIFAGDGEPAPRSVTGMLSGLAAVPARAAHARASMNARVETARAARAERTVEAPPSRSARPAGIFTGLLTGLGRRMRRRAGPSTAVDRPPRDIVRWDDRPVGGLFARMRGAQTPPTGSLFDRTLAEAAAVQDRTTMRPVAAPVSRPEPPRVARAARLVGDATPSLASGLRARSGYAQAMPSADEIVHETRLSELQRAIEYARRRAS